MLLHRVLIGCFDNDERKTSSDSLLLFLSPMNLSRTSPLGIFIRGWTKKRTVFRPFSDVDGLDAHYNQFIPALMIYEVHVMGRMA